MIKKPRKPKTLKLNKQYEAYLCEHYFPIHLFQDNHVYPLALKEAKRLHKWLGQAIAYLEQTKAGD